MVLSSVQVSLHALKVQALCLRAVIAVVLPLVAYEVSDGSVDGPGGVGDQEVDVFMRVPLREESEAKAESASAGNRLGTSDSVLLTSAAVLTIGESDALVNIRLNTVDGGVLVIHVALEDELFGALDAR